MKITEISKSNEQYYCPSCKKNTTVLGNNWTCQQCGKLLKVKTILDKEEFACLIIPIEHLEIGNILILNNHSHKVLGIKKDKTAFLIALKDYGSLPIALGSTVRIIDSPWTY